MDPKEQVKQQADFIEELKAQKEIVERQIAQVQYNLNGAVKFNNTEQVKELSEEANKLQTELETVISAITNAKNDLKGAKSDVNELKKQSSFELLETPVRKLGLRYIADQDKIVTCQDTSGDPNVCDPRIEYIPANRVVRILNNHTPQLLDLHYTDVIDWLQTHKLDGSEPLSFDGIASTLNEHTYYSTKRYNAISQYRTFWLVPNENAKQYDPDVDFWLDCLGGGKQENVEHIIQLILFKLYFPEKVANLPNVDISSNPGGTGKGTLITVLRTIFTPACVAITNESAFDKFNASWLDKVWVIVDDQENINNNKLKSFTGDDRVLIEPKGVDQFQAERMFNLIIAHQGPEPAVKLTGGGRGSEDRRWSVMFSNTSMIDKAKDKIKAKNPSITDDELDTQSAEYVDQVVKKMKDRKLIADWLGCMTHKYLPQLQDKGVLGPLHGQDYKKLNQLGKDSFDVAMATLVDLFKNSNGISVKLAHQVLKVLCPGKVPAVNALGPKLEVALSYAKIPFTQKKAVRVEEVYGSDTNVVQPQTTYYLFNGNTKCVDDYALVLVNKPAMGKAISQSLSKSMQTPADMVYDLECLAS